MQTIKKDRNKKTGEKKQVKKKDKQRLTFEKYNQV